MLSAVKIHVCAARYAGFVQAAPVWLESSHMPRELPGGGVGTLSCVPAFGGASSHLYESVLSGPRWHFSEKRLIYNGDMPFLSQETPSAPFLPFRDFLCFSFLFKKVKLYIILAQLGISDNQFPLKSCRDGKWGLPSLEMNFYLPDYFFYNELVNDPQSWEMWLSFSDHFTSFPFPSAAKDNLENILDGTNGSRLQGPPLISFMMYWTSLRTS